MKHNIRTLQKDLPFYYFLLLFLTFTLLVSSFCAYYLKNLRTSEYTNIQNISRSVTSNLEQEIGNMSTASLNTIYSNSIRPEISALADPNLSASEIYNKQQSLYKSIFEIIGLQNNIVQINIYPVNYASVGSGIYTYRKNISLEDKEWFEDVVTENGYRHMTVPHPMSYYISPSPFSDNMYYISLVRLYYNQVHQIDGAVEILQKCSDFFKNADEILVGNPNLNIYILNENQEIIYPTQKTDKQTALYYNQKFIDEELSFNKVHLIKDNQNKKNAVIKSSIPSVGWNIYITEPDSVISDSLTSPIIFFICILILTLTLTLYICFRISKRILYPIQQLQNTFELIHLDDLISSSEESLHLPESHYIEIKTLIDAFENMYTKLNRSTILLLQSQEEEIKAKEIATQSLMKPHFLYNNLANISIMAEENMNQEIITLTENLCDYLRYTSAAGTNKVSIKDEFFYTEKYLLCMKVRYKDRLHYSFSLDTSVEDITVPKLIVQPLVENALKYAFFKNPPWMLNISCFNKNGFWFISVTDNGAGFSDDIKQEIFLHLGKIKKTRDISQMKIGGMGLANVYLRLLLMYGDDIIFKIENNTDCGACITIGGKIEHD